MNSSKHLKVYNEDRLNVNPDTAKIYVTEGLSKSPYLQKKQLLPFYEKTRSENKRASWCIQNGKFRLIVDGKRVMIKQLNVINTRSSRLLALRNCGLAKS